jgi:hypothetical protein
MTSTAIHADGTSGSVTGHARWAKAGARWLEPHPARGGRSGRRCPGSSPRGAHFRNDIVTGFGGKQILLDDPSGNAIELFEPRPER